MKKAAISLFAFPAGTSSPSPATPVVMPSNGRWHASRPCLRQRPPRGPALPWQSGKRWISRSQRSTRSALKFRRDN